MISIWHSCCSTRTLFLIRTIEIEIECHSKCVHCAKCNLFVQLVMMMLLDVLLSWHLHTMHISIINF